MLYISCPPASLLKQTSCNAEAVFLIPVPHDICTRTLRKQESVQRLKTIRPTDLFLRVNRTRARWVGHSHAFVELCSRVMRS